MAGSRQDRRLVTSAWVEGRLDQLEHILFQPRCHVACAQASNRASYRNGSKEGQAGSQHLAKAYVGPGQFNTPVTQEPQKAQAESRSTACKPFPQWVDVIKPHCGIALNPELPILAFGPSFPIPLNDRFLRLPVGGKTAHMSCFTFRCFFERPRPEHQRPGARSDALPRPGVDCRLRR